VLAGGRTQVVVLHDGERIEGVPGQANFRRIRFAEHGIPVVVAGFSLGTLPAQRLAQTHPGVVAAILYHGGVPPEVFDRPWPAGLPLIMTRYWPMAMVQIPTAIYMISGFMNSVRIVYLDGRKHTDPDIIVRTYNGESIGSWEGDTLVVDTVGFRGDHHWMDQGGVAIPAGEQLHIVERFRMVGNQLEIEYTMTDPEHWEGDWKSTKRFNRVIDEDIQEVSCLPDLNEHLQSTTSKTQVLK